VSRREEGWGPAVSLVRDGCVLVFDLLLSTRGSSYTPVIRLLRTLKSSKRTNWRRV